VAPGRNESPPKPLRILLAEDNLVNQKVATLTLSRLGHTAEIAVDGREAVEAVRDNDYDLIFMDMQMPRLAGSAATKEIRKIRYGSLRPYIVAMTASAREEDKIACLEAGMNDFITKPLSESRLKELFRTFAENSEAANETREEILTS
jgi:CheY-like chemotaxis protein